MSQITEHIIGIDLGTSNSVVAVLDGETPRVVVNSEGHDKTPSVVAFKEDGSVLVGEIARRQASIAPHRTVTSVKRILGRNLNDLNRMGLRLPYELAAYEGSVVVKVDDKGYTPSHVSAFILKKLKQSAEDFLGSEVTKAIITVPAYFDDVQRQATREAGRLAGLEVMRLLNEPTAAAMAYGIEKNTNGRVAVFDLGGGTFDLTILDIHEGTFEVLTTAGDTRLGGDDIDDAIVNHLVARFQADTGLSGYEPDAMALRRLKEAAEKAKCELSSSRQAVISLPFLAQHGTQPVHLDATITLDLLEKIVQPFGERCIDICEEALDSKGLRIADIDKVILVGGSTRIPLIQDMVEDYFGAPPFKGLNPDEVVARGAAVQAGVMAGKLKEVILLDVTPHSLGVEVEGGRVVHVISRNSTIPATQSRMFTTTEDQQEVVMVNVLQGESTKAAENRSLGRFSLSGVAGGKAGQARVQVTFAINADGVVEVTAEDMTTKTSRVVQLLVSSDDSSPVQGSGERGGEQRKRRRARRSGKSDTPTSSPDWDRSTSPDLPTVSSNIRVVNTPVPMEPIQFAPSAPPPASVPASAPIPLPPPPAPVPVPPSAPVPSGSAARSRQPRDGSSSGVSAAAFQAPTGEITTGDTRFGSPLTPPAAAPVPLPSPALEAALIPDTNQLFSARQGAASPSKPESPLSAAARQAVEYIRTEAFGATAFKAYADAAEELQHYAISNRQDKDVADATARVLIALGEQSAARRLLLAMGEDTDCDAVRLAALYELFLQKFPRDEAATTGLAQTLAYAGRVEDAIEKLEKVTTEEGADATQIEHLVQLYRSRLAQVPEDHGTQFKLVKLLIRTGKVDEAVNLLQRLVNVDSYRPRALKILGLCFWQKGLHYLAWQKFQQLPLNDEIRDVLYRLSADMEDTDQLLNAKVVLQHLYQDNPNFRDVSDRLQKVENMVRLEVSDREANLTPSIFLTLKDSRFVILEEINRGSMGIVYRAKDKVLEEIVALKILNDYMTADPTAVERFKREARAAKRLAHPNIVRIHDMFEYGNKKILSMEYIDGRDLKKILLERRVLDPKYICKVGREAADALGYAHGISVVHRDIKPANIMITIDDRVKVTDFGIAKLLAGNDTTRSGSQIIGTPLYMSPEQIRGGQVDARTDIYSLGATLYEMAAGRPPFIEGNIEYHHLHTVPAALPNNIPPRLQEIILKCLAKDPEQRFQSTGELIKGLDEVSSTLAT